MNRALVCTLTLAIAAVASSAMAQVGLSLNLTYTDPADPSEGGTWELVALGTDVVGVSAIIDGIDDPAGVVTNPAGLGTLIDDPNNPTFAPVFSVGSGVYEVGFVQDNTAGLTGGVGAGGPDDPLNNSLWNGATVIVTGGTFGATRPSFVSAGINSTEVNVLSGGSAVAGSFATIDGVLSPTVRGDSANTLALETPAGAGLIIGDTDRGGSVDLFGDVLTALNNVGTGTTWDEGDFDDSETIDLFGDVLSALNNVGASFTPPAIGAVPEPSSAVLLGLAAAGLGFRRRR